MLFDLRGRGRRRAVQVIYATLAILMGGGLVLFGVGGAVDGGLLNAFQGDQSSVTDVNKEQLKEAEAKVRANRDSAEAWASLAKVRLARARAIGYDPNQDAFTEEGLNELREADRAWQKSLELSDKPDATTAAVMITAYLQGALDEPKEAVRAQEIILEARKKPDSTDFAQYAVLAFEAGQLDKGDRAVAKAVSLAPRAQRKNLREQLAQAKTRAITQSAQEASQTATTASP
ncbi:MAG TPA: hypothetical protein PKB03_04350 [Baekduia sp.]|nr:hypothetical protein [Baekduia sp.]